MQPQTSSAISEPPTLSERERLPSDSLLFPPVDRPIAPRLKVLRSHLAVVGGLVVAADLCLYQSGGGLAGWSLWCIVAPVLLLAGTFLSGHGRRGYDRFTAAAGALLLLTSFRLLWQGNSGLATISIFQLAVFIVLLKEVPLSLTSVSRFMLTWLPQGCRCIPAATICSLGLSTARVRWLEYGLPIATAGVFAAIFLLANPIAVKHFSIWLQHWFGQVQQWLLTIRPGQPIVWLLAAVLGLGALVPTWKDLLRPKSVNSPAALVRTEGTKPRADVNQLYLAGRNTLVVVIVLFAVYLVAEFCTMWLRNYPEGFHYSGYAHAGAAWLTVALGLATIVMSAIFRPMLAGSNGYERLLVLARIWSWLNYLLAVCVFNRLFIYIDYNGMTRMRVVAIVGVCCVIAGFVLVMRKARKRLSFAWLVERQVMALVAFIYLLAILPVDWLVYSYNSAKVLGGKESPAVQITEHQLSSSAMLAVLPLIESGDKVISDGVAALTARHLEFIAARNSLFDLQLSDLLLRHRVSHNHQSAVATYLGDTTSAELAIARFKEKMWKWY